MVCTAAQNLKIVPGGRADYESLSQYHYRNNSIGPYAAIYALKGRFRTAECLETVGVIVYSMPVAGCSTRNAVMPFLAGLDRRTRLHLLNKNVRTISRVIIEPRFRSLGLATKLVRETMPLLNVPFIEALAVMGQVNPFFEKAGMTQYDAPSSPACVRLIEAFCAIGVSEQDLIEPGLVQQKLDKLRTEDGGQRMDFIEREMILFLQSYGRRRMMPAGIERTAFILSKLTDRPVYYLWQNTNVEFSV